jgi:acetyl-CoA carboxylase alpha subunit
MSLLKKLNETIASLLLKDKEIISRNQVVNEHNVYQLARKDNRPAIFNLLTECLKEGSTIQGIENWDTFYNNYKKWSIFSYFCGT